MIIVVHFFFSLIKENNTYLSAQSSLIVLIQVK